MQRPSILSRGGGSDEENPHILDIPNLSPRNNTKGMTAMTMEEGGLIIPTHSLINHRRRISPSRFSSENWLHLIPLIVFLCLVILWWFSYPETVNVKIEDGRIIEVVVTSDKRPLEQNNVDLTSLAVARPPHTSSLHNPQATHQETAAEPASGTAV